MAYSLFSITMTAMCSAGFAGAARVIPLVIWPEAPQAASTSPRQQRRERRDRVDRIAMSPGYLRRSVSLAPIPEPALSLVSDRRGEARLVDDHAGALVGDGEELGDLDDANRLETAPDFHRLGRPPIGTDPGGRGIGIDRRGSGSCCLQTLDRVNRPSESRLIGVRWVTTDDEHAPHGIEPALDVVVHALASHDPPPTNLDGGSRADVTG